MQVNAAFRSLLAYPFNIMLQKEAKQLAVVANQQKDIVAWYSPMAVWPEFNAIQGQRVMCVPDLVTSEFAVGFGSSGGSTLIENHERMIAAIEGADQLITYSQSVKWDVLIDRFGVAPKNVHVVPHAPSRVDSYIDLMGFKDIESTTKAHCVSLLERAIYRSATDSVMKMGTVTDIEFLFYPSQFRPNKNILTLLRAFSDIIRVENRGHKLFLTGDLESAEEVGAFITENNLSRDVIVLSRLSVEELAACYKLAKLAVNPSLSEGGCPFTFTEALSVGTPVVMGRIHVTEEVITDEALSKDMLFDPFDWVDMSKRICWALDNREELLKRQLAFYDKATKARTWAAVLDDHLKIMDGQAR